MGNSLQDQLLKAGLIDQKKIDEAEKQKRRQAAEKKHAGKKKKAPRVERPQPTPEQLEKAARDRELEQQRAEVRRQREVAAQVRQLVRDNRIPRPERDDDIAFHFDNKGKVKRLMVSADVHSKISAGQLKIVNDNGVFELVKPAVADKIRARNPSLVIDLPEEQKADADDPYADFKVPDDLMW
ncbi:MAG: DUF2058 domain-containing protein [Chromatiaceae bacterium]|nr:DUF2058 domain-containing protein [Chromatiaceae bacterium]MCP5422597.1 DUF2058 domain-containing protein [Chromatiaceae bacterium]